MMVRGRAAHRHFSRAEVTSTHMNIALWVVAAMVALLFGFSGANKVLAIDKYRERAA